MEKEKVQVPVRPVYLYINHVYNKKGNKEVYEVDETKREVTINLHTAEFGIITATAKCEKSDTFDKEVGKRVAKYKALRQLKKIALRLYRSDVRVLKEQLLTAEARVRQTKKNIARLEKLAEEGK